jgi:hypothetical protein
LPAPEPIEKLKQAAHPIDSSQQHQQIRIELIKESNDKQESSKKKLGGRNKKSSKRPRSEESDGLEGMVVLAL